MSDFTSAGARSSAKYDAVIAKYTPWGLCLNIAAMAVIMGLCWITILRHPAGTTALAYAWATDKEIVVYTFLGTLLAVWFTWSMLRQVMYHGGRAIWIENGNLNYRAYGMVSFSSLPLASIQDVSVKQFFLRPTRIVIHARGKVHYVGLFFFSASADVICARLSEAVFGKTPRQFETAPEAH